MYLRLFFCATPRKPRRSNQTVRCRKTKTDYKGRLEWQVDRSYRSDNERSKASLRIRQHRKGQLDCFSKELACSGNLSHQRAIQARVRNVVEKKIAVGIRIIRFPIAPSVLRASQDLLSRIPPLISFRSCLISRNRIISARDKIVS